MTIAPSLKPFDRAGSLFGYPGKEKEPSTSFIQESQEISSYESNGYIEAIDVVDIGFETQIDSTSSVLYPQFCENLMHFGHSFFQVVRIKGACPGRVTSCVF